MSADKDFLKQLRRDVKKGNSNYQLSRFLDSIYEAGYAQALKDTNKVITETITNAYKEPNPSDHVDGVGLQPEGGVVGRSIGSDADDRDSLAGSAEPVSASAAEGQDGPTVQHPVLNLVPEAPES